VKDESLKLEEFYHFVVGEAASRLVHSVHHVHCVHHVHEKQELK
jgi:hypothetical protein